MKKHSVLWIGNLVLLSLLLIHSVIQYAADSLSWPFFGVVFFTTLYYITPFALFNLGYGLYRLIKRWYL